MSEYQRYEFVCVDQQLTATQQAELRRFSARATITASRFVNEYHRGNFKGDPLEWMRQYFDAHVYFSSWGNRRLLLRLPRGTFDAETICPYVKEGRGTRRTDIGKAFEAIDVAEGCILDWSFDDEPGECPRFVQEMDSACWMTYLLPVREELLGGDVRPLYLGWLARVGSGELCDDDLEPPLPAGLQALTPAQVALAEFLMLDADWLAAAAEDSPPLPSPLSGETGGSRFDPWLCTLQVDEMRAILRILLQRGGQEAERTFMSAFLRWEKDRVAKPLDQRRRRRIGEIESSADSHRAIRERQEQQTRETTEVHRRGDRTRYLATLLEQQEVVWSSIDAHLQRTAGSACDQALQKLQDLAEAYASAGQDSVFRCRLAQLLSPHGESEAWLARLQKAGICRSPADGSLP